MMCDVFQGIYSINTQINYVSYILNLFKKLNMLMKTTYLYSIWIPPSTPQ